MKMNFKYTAAMACMASAVLFTSCGEDPEPPTPTPPAESTIYADLGGTNMVSDPVGGGSIEQGYLSLRSVVDSAILIIAGDDILSPYFSPLLAEVGVDGLAAIGPLSLSLTNFFAANTGGSATYSGLNMVDAHRPSTNRRNEFLVNDAAYDRFVEVVVEAAGKNGVAADAPVVGKLAVVLESLRSSIVQTTDGVEAQTDIYQKLGGNTMVDDPNSPGTKIEAGYLTLRSVVDSTIFVIAGDDDLNQEYFSVLLGEVMQQGAVAATRPLSLSLTNFFATATGSENPAYAYSGLNMVDAHDPNKNARMGNTADDAAFDAFVADVVIGAGKNGVPANAPIIGELNALLQTLRGDIVQR